MVSVRSISLLRPSERRRDTERTTEGGHGRLSTLPSLTGLRWYAALLVFLYHVSVVQYFGGRPAMLAEDRKSVV